MAINVQKVECLIFPNSDIIESQPESRAFDKNKISITWQSTSIAASLPPELHTYIIGYPEFYVAVGACVLKFGRSILTSLTTFRELLKHTVYTKLCTMLTA